MRKVGATPKRTKRVTNHNRLGPNGRGVSYPSPYPYQLRCKEGSNRSIPQVYLPSCVVSESAVEGKSFDPIDFIFAEEIENIKGAILSSARAAGGTHGPEGGRDEAWRKRKGGNPTHVVVNDHRRQRRRSRSRGIHVFYAPNVALDGG